MIDTRKIKARFGTEGNTKLGKTVGTWSTLKGNKEYYIPELDMTVRGTCGKYCEGCKDDCYVEKSYFRWTNAETGKCSVKYGHAKNTIAMREDLEKCFEDLNNQMNRKRVKFELIRIDQSGEIETREQFEMFCKLGAWHEDTIFYIYTKNTDVVVPCLLEGIVPKNFIVLISIWHEYGIEEYKKVAHLENVKAFVYIDYNKDKVNGWNFSDYAKRGIMITTMCNAYDIHGKMNHDLTCDKCGKCHRKSLCSKVIGTYAH